MWLCRYNASNIGNIGNSSIIENLGMAANVGNAGKYTEKKSAILTQKCVSK